MQEDRYVARLARLRGINLNLLLVFDTLYRQRSLTLAASAMCLTQPAVSHSLKKLRELLDDPLLVKGPEGMVPTPLAHQMHAAIDQGLFHLDQALTQRESFIPERSRREFRIGICDDAVSAALQPGVLAHALRHARQVCFHWLPVRISREEQVQAVIEAENLDAVVVQFDSMPLQLPHDHLFDDPIGCVGDRRWHGEDDCLSLETLVTTPQVALSHREQSPLLINDTLRRQGLMRGIIAKTPLTAPLASMLPGTELLAVVTASAARLLRQAPELRFYRLPLEVAPFRVCLATDQRCRQDAGVDWLRRLLLSSAAGITLAAPGARDASSPIPCPD